MKLRAVFNRQREVLELLGDSITLGDCREAVYRKFGVRTNSFNISLNGQDILDDDTVLLTDLGIVNGDLIHVLPASDTEQQGDVPGNQTQDFSAYQSLSSHFGGVEQHGSAASTSQSQEAHTSTGNEQTIRSETQQIQQLTSSGTSIRLFVLLCREGVPEALEELYGAAEVGTIHEAAWVVIHFLMLETGYICASEDSAVESTGADKSVMVVPPGAWKTGRTAKINYTHASCPGLTCSLTCTSLGPYLMIHGLVDSVSTSEIFQCKLQPTDFVRGNVDLKIKGASSVYYNLHRLSRLIKDQVAYPLLSFMRSALGLPPLCGLMALPAEVKLLILGRLSVQSIASVGRTCREMHLLSNDATLWQHLFFRDFGRREKDKNRSWKSEYKILFERKIAQDLIALQVLVPPEMFPPVRGIGSHPFRGDIFPPGIRGGHSDLFPNLPFIPGGINPTPGAVPAPGLPRPRFDPFGPLPDINQMPEPSRRGGRRSGPPGNLPPGFL